jgi:hypothetical protein
VEYLKSHPVAAIVLGVVIGIAFGSQLKRLPLVSKIPSA